MIAILVIFFGYVRQALSSHGPCDMDVGDKIDQIGDIHLKYTTNIFCLQYPTSTSTEHSELPN